MTDLEIMTLTRMNAYEMTLDDLNSRKDTRTAATRVMAVLLREEETWKYLTRKKERDNG